MKKLLDKKLFLSRVDTSGECWIWNGARTRGGYGNLRLNGKYLGAHRLSFQIHKGEIPKGFDVCHRCDNPPCVNPKHLFLGTRFENVLDMQKKGRGRRGETAYQSKFTNAQVKEIRDSYACGGLSQRSIARKYGVQPMRINDIIHNRTWKMKNKKLISPKPGEWYSLQMVVTNRMFGWCPSSFWSVRNTVEMDARCKNILKPVITGTGRATKYQFKGENIIKFVKLIEAGTYRLS